MLIGIRDVADIERERQPPRRLYSLDVVDPALAQDRLDVNDRHAERADLVVKRVDGGDDVARPRRRAGAIGGVGEVALMHVDRDDCGVADIGEFFEPRRKLALSAIDIGLHGARSSFGFGCAGHGSAFRGPGADGPQESKVRRTGASGAHDGNALIRRDGVLDPDRDMERLPGMERQLPALVEVLNRPPAFKNKDRILGLGMDVGHVGLARLHPDIVHVGRHRSDARPDDQPRITRDDRQHPIGFVTVVDANSHGELVQRSARA